MRRILPAALLLVAAATWGQSSRTGASLSVTVTDQSDAAIVGASVQVTNQDNGLKRTTATDQEGRAVVAELVPGAYTVSASAVGFAVANLKDVQLGLGARMALSLTLKPAAVAQEVAVTAEQSTLDAGQTGVTTSIEPERIEESPVSSRNYLDFVLLAPGLASSTQKANSGQRIPQPDSGFAFAGQRPRSNTLYIDGAENNDEFTGATRTELSLELVREFQVVNNGLAAEAGGGSGGTINVITRSGANTIHGDAFLFLQNGA